MRQVKVLEIKNWKQDPKVEKIIPVIVTIKNTSFTRIDDEVITITDSGEDMVTYKTNYTAACIFEVYPDEDSFRRRSLPITVFREKFTINPEDSFLHSYNQTDTFKNEILLLLNEEFIFNQLKDNQSLEQDFKSGEVRIILL